MWAKVRAGDLEVNVRRSCTIIQRKDFHAVSLPMRDKDGQLAHVLGR
jgi:hypothetical protein